MLEVGGGDRIACPVCASLSSGVLRASPAPPRGRLGLGGRSPQLSFPVTALARESWPRLRPSPGGELLTASYLGQLILPNGHQAVK